MIILDIMLKRDTILKNHPNSNLLHSDLKSKQSHSYTNADGRE